MADTTTTETTDRIELEGSFGSVGLPEFTGTVGEAIGHALDAAEPVEIGDHGILIRRTSSDVLEKVDERQFEDFPRSVSHTEKVVGVDSFVAYFNEFADAERSRVYVADVYGKGVSLLVGPNQIATGRIDDYAAPDAELDPRARRHAVGLILTPTAAARRWGTALAKDTMSQEEFLDLVDDGVGEIADPDTAVLRDLVANLHAIRSTEVSSVIRSAGQGRIQLTENATLAAGSGNEVEFPSTLTLVLNPFAGLSDVITLVVKLAPSITDTGKVRFGLRAPVLDDALTTVIQALAATLAAETGRTPIWTP